MKIGIVQLNSGFNRTDNMAGLVSLLDQALGADLVVTPECTNLMGFDPKRDQIFTADKDPVVEFIRQWALENKTSTIIGSAILQDENGQTVNRQLMINSDGEIISHYDKIHMFDVTLPTGEDYRESARLKAGEICAVTEIAGHKFGHAICFDLRFPALFSALALAGAEALLVPAAFTQFTGRAHWEILLRARAIENGAFVIAPAQTGAYLHSDGSTRHCYGRSLVVSPWGEVLMDLGDKPSVGIIEVDFSRVSRTRADIPVLTATRKIPKPTHYRS